MVDKWDNAQLGRLAEMRNTEGWQLFKQALEAKCLEDIRYLVQSNKFDVEEITKRRARVKNYTEILCIAGIKEEELRWQKLL